MGIRVDLVDKEIYQVNPNFQKANLMGLAPGAKEEEWTAKQLEELKQQLLSEKDKFVLSDKDTVPTFDQTEKEIELSLAKHALLLKKQMEDEKRLRAVSGGELGTDSAPLVYTGAPQCDTKQAVA
jgi:hypothetical protein